MYLFKYEDKIKEISISPFTLKVDKKFKFPHMHVLAHTHSLYIENCEAIYLTLCLDSMGNSVK